MIPFSTQRFAEEWTAKITSELNRPDVKAPITLAARKWAMLGIIANLEACVAVLVKSERKAQAEYDRARTPPVEPEPPVPQPVVTLLEGDLPPALLGSVVTTDLNAPRAVTPPTAPAQPAPESTPDSSPLDASQ